MSKNNNNLLYRGIKLPIAEVEAYEPGRTIHLTGYTSTSRSMDIALEFAHTDCSEAHTPVVLEILFLKSYGFFELTHEFTAYPEESEVLV